jgi:molecular chaperone GrpE
MMWSRLIRLFGINSRDDLEAWKDELLEELDGIKKILRRQSVFAEAFKKEALGLMEERRLKDAGPILELAENFFHFERALREGPGLPSAQEEAFELVWEKMDVVLSGLGLELIREPGEAFDPRLHQAVERAAEPGENMRVVRIIQPGYILNGRVAKPARVIIGELTERTQEP